MNPNIYYRYLLDQIKDEIDTLIPRTSHEVSSSYARTLKTNQQGMSDMLSFIRMNPVPVHGTAAQDLLKILSVKSTHRQQT